jgi:hypothetical protein
VKVSKTLKYLTVGLAALGVTIFVTLWSNGAFKEVNVKTGPQGGFLLVGADHKGSYQKIGSVFAKVKEAQQKSRLDSAMFVGVYFDDPGKIDEANLRSFAAFVVKDSATALKVASENPGFHLLYIPKTNAYFAEIATKGMISNIIAAVKAYPKLGEAITADRVSPNAQGMAFEEYHNGFVRFVMQVQ